MYMLKKVCYKMCENCILYLIRFINKIIIKGVVGINYYVMVINGLESSLNAMETCVLNTL